MKTISFTFRDGLTSEAEKSDLSLISTWPGVNHAGRLNPKARNAVSRRMCFLFAEDTANVSELLQQLRMFPSIEDAVESVERGLIT